MGFSALFIRSFSRSAKVAMLLFTTTAYAGPAALPDCSQGTVIFADNATITRPQVSLQPGVLFSDGGQFQEHPVGVPCDPGKFLGPFEVDAGGELVVHLNGAPGIIPVWSLRNLGVGIAVRFEPRVGQGFGPANEIARIVLGAEETETEGGGVWHGPGRITVLVSAPTGAGALSGSCFEQSYSAVGEIVAVEQTMPLRAGIDVSLGDSLATGAAGRIIIRAGINTVLDLGQRTNVTYADGPTVVRSQPADIATARLADDREAWADVVAGVMDKFQEMGYPQPIQPDLSHYMGFLGSPALWMLYQRFGTMTDQCKAAVYAKLYLDAQLDESSIRTGLAYSLETMAAIYLPNNWKIVGWLSKKALRFSIPGIGYVEAAQTAISFIGVLDKYSSHLGVEEAAQVRLEIYERSMRENWDAERVASERRQRFDETRALSAQLNALSVIRESDVAILMSELEQKLAQTEATLTRRLREINADEAVNSETARRINWLERHPDYGNPDVYFPPGVIVQGRITKEEMRQIYISEASGSYDRARNGVRAAAWAEENAARGLFNITARWIEWEYNRQAVKRVHRIEQLRTEEQTLKDFIVPIVTDNCASLRNTAPEKPSCPPLQTRLLGGIIRYTNPPLPGVLQGIVPEGNPVDNPYDPLLGGDILSISVDDLLARPHGTDWEVEKNEAGSMIRVFDGEVLVHRSDENRILLEAGQELSVASGVITDLPEGAGVPLELHGLPVSLWPMDPDQSAPYGPVPLLLEDGRPANGWVWQDPGEDVQILAGDAPGEVVISVPDGNDLWQHRADAPRLLRKVTGDFDLELGLNLSLPEGANHLAFSGFLLYAPGSQIGYLAEQADAPTAPGADIRQMGGGWTRFEHVSSLPVWSENKGFTPPDDANVQLRFSRRGDLFFSQWSLDGEIWTLSTRERIALPETIWTGMGFKRLAHDGHPDANAVNTLTNMVLTSAAPGTILSEPMLLVQAAGRVMPLFDGWQLAHDPETPSTLALTMSRPIEDDFDVVLRVDMAGFTAAAGQGVAVSLYAAGITTHDWAYVALSAGTTYGGRYQTDQNVDGRANRYEWTDTADDAGWLRMIRKDGINRASYWEMGRWVEMDTYQTRQEAPLFIGVKSWTNWGSSTVGSAFLPEVMIERLVLGDAAGGEYDPQGYSMLSEVQAPALELPEGVVARLYTAPHNVQSPFFDDDGNIYLLPLDQHVKLLIRLDPDGVSTLAGEGVVYAGRNRKRGLWLDGALLISVDSWGDGGNTLGGLYRVAADGGAIQVPLTPALGGLSCLKQMPDGSLIMCDFEHDGLWQVQATGGEITNLMAPTLHCPQDAAISETSGTVYVVNNGASYSCYGPPGLFRLLENGTPELIIAPTGEAELGGLVWVSGGMFGEGLVLVDPRSGTLLRPGAQEGTPVTLLENLTHPGDLAADPQGKTFAIILNGQQVLVLTLTDPEAGAE